MRRLRKFASLFLVCLFLTALVSPPVSRADSFALRPGHVYGVVQGGVAEWDAQLNPVASLLFPDVTVTEGVAFTPNGNLVFSAFEGRVNPTHYVLEVGPSGAVLHDLDLGL